MIKVVFASIISVIVLQILKQYRSDYSIIFKLAAILFIGFLLINELNTATKFSFLTEANNETISYIPIILKTLGIVIITQIASNICHDSGEEALSTVTELVGKVFILITCIPLIEALYTLVKGYLE